MSRPPALEALFSALGVEVVVPTTDAFPAPPERGGDSAAWWHEVRGLPRREAAFLDEKLAYAVALRLPYSSLPADEHTPPELRALLKQIQVTATASFLPAVAPPPPRDTLAAPPRAATGDSVQNDIAAPAPKAASLAPPTFGTKPASSGPNAAQHADSRPPELESGEGGSPLTPRPLPSTSPGAEAYADLEGVTVWEGGVDVDGDRPTIVKTDNAWVAVFRGELPVVYVRTQIANPVFALTASATLRDMRTRRSAAAGVGSDTASIRSEGTVQIDEAEEEEPIDIARMEEIDLLGGLANDHMPASRLGPSLLDDLAMTTPVTPASSASPWTPLPLDVGVTLRKSYRTVMALLPGLRVRMRTLFLPQLLPPGASAGNTDDADDTMERKIVLCVEVENGADSGEYAFEIDSVSVDVGGKGPKATAELVCQPGMDVHSSNGASEPDGPVFPLQLSVLEQYNLLYAVTIESSPGMGGPEAARSKSDENRPVSIVLTGRPFRGTRTSEDTTHSFPTAPFQSRWNCSLDLAPFYASMPPPPPPPPAQAAAPRQSQHRVSKPMPPAPPSAIAGDKRYSLANLLAADAPDRRMVSNPQRPISLPSTIQSRVMSTRGGGPTPAPIGDGHGLFVSVRLLPPGAGTSSASATSEVAINPSRVIHPLDTFFIEVFVHNRTDAMRRFRLGVPGRDSADARIRDLWIRRRRRNAEEPSYGVDDYLLAALLSQHEAAAPPLVALETDVRCGPLLPGASLAARIRFLALRDGVHRIDRLRLTGIGDDFDFVISPVLEVVVDQKAL